MTRVQAILLADHIYRDQHTGKHVVAGTFQQVNVPHVPTTLPHSVGVFLALTGVADRASVRLEFADPDGTVLVESARIDVQCGDPVEQVEIGLEMPMLPLPRLGTYTLRATVDGTAVAEAAVRVAAAEAR